MKELTNKVGVSEATIRRWESGEISNMRRDSIIKLSEVLEIPRSDNYEPILRRLNEVSIIGEYTGTYHVIKKIETLAVTICGEIIENKQKY